MNVLSVVLEQRRRQTEVVALGGGERGARREGRVEALEAHALVRREEGESVLKGVLAREDIGPIG